VIAMIKSNKVTRAAWHNMSIYEIVKLQQVLVAPTCVITWPPNLQ
jgi:hypothetical protein